MSIRAVEEEAEGGRIGEGEGVEEKMVEESDKEKRKGT